MARLVSALVGLGYAVGLLVAQPEPRDLLFRNSTGISTNPRLAAGLESESVELG